MNDTDYDEDDLGFLVSRSLDETLSVLEQRRLEAALADSKELRREAEQLGAVQRLIARWGARPAEADWDHQAALIVAQVAGDDDALLDRVDQLIGRWGDAAGPPIPSSFAEDVVQRLAGGARRPARFAAIFRLGVPLAAAAAIALAFVGPTWFVDTAPALSVVHFGGSAVTVQPTARTVVSFGRAPAPGGAARSEHSTVTFSVVGAGAMPWTYREGPVP